MIKPSQQLAFELCSHMCTLRCQSPSACTKPRAFEKPAGRGGSLRAQSATGGKKTSNISPESCPITSSALLVTESNDDEGDRPPPREASQQYGLVAAWCTCGEGDVAVRYTPVRQLAGATSCLIAPPPVACTNAAVRAPQPDRQTPTNLKESIGGREWSNRTGKEGTLLVQLCLASRPRAARAKNEKCAPRSSTRFRRRYSSCWNVPRTDSPGWTLFCQTDFILPAVQQYLWYYNSGHRTAPTQHVPQDTTHALKNSTMSSEREIRRERRLKRKEKRLHGWVLCTGC